MDDARRVLSGMTEEQQQRYSGLIAAVTKVVEQIAREGLAPEAVADVVGEAVTAERPRARYVVGRDAKIQALARQVVRRDLDADAVARVHADPRAAHAAGHMGQHGMSVVELDAEHQVGQGFLDDALEGKLLFDGHVAVTSGFDWNERRGTAGRQTLGKF
jgi:hypothetical protein